MSGGVPAEPDRVPVLEVSNVTDDSWGLVFVGNMTNTQDYMETVNGSLYFVNWTAPAGLQTGQTLHFEVCAEMAGNITRAQDSATVFDVSGGGAFNSLIESTAEPAGANCVEGGQKVETGLDNGDGGGTAGDGVLQAGEIDNTFFVCDGLEGKPGAVSVSYIIQSGTYTPPENATRLLFECVGAGGGGGGSATDAIEARAGGGGGAGGYARLTIDGAEASYDVTVGIGGAGGAAGQNNGSNGGNTTLSNATGTLLTCHGGAGGESGAAGAEAAGGGGGAAVGGDVNAKGAAGGNSRVGVTPPESGRGASSYFGDGGRAALSTAAGAAGDAPGAGGSGGVSAAGTTDQAGGDGGNGLIIVWEFGADENATAEEEVESMTAFEDALGLTAFEFLVFPVTAFLGILIWSRSTDLGARAFGSVLCIISGVLLLVVGVQAGLGTIWQGTVPMGFVVAATGIYLLVRMFMDVVAGQSVDVGGADR